MRTFARSILRQVLNPKESIKEYDSFKSALNDSHTYEDKGVIDVVLKKTDLYKTNLLLSQDLKKICSRQTVQNLFVLNHIVTNNNKLNILEMGGACGATYLKLDSLNPSLIKKWHVVETPAMADAGKRHFQNSRLLFFSEIDEAVKKLERKHLIIAQGVLQYTRDPIKALESLLELGFDYVYVTRTLIGKNINELVITKQVVNLSEHGPGTVTEGFADRKTSQPLTIIPFDSIDALVSDNYNVLFKFEEGNYKTLKIGRRSVDTQLFGFLAKNVH